MPGKTLPQKRVKVTQPKPPTSKVKWMGGKVRVKRKLKKIQWH